MAKFSCGVLGSVVLVMVLLGCPAPTPPTDAELNARYAAAVADAQTPEPADIHRGLTAITPWQEGLVWEGTPGKSRIRMTTWTSWGGYEVGAKMIAGAKYQPAIDLWVTAVPEVKDFVRRHRLPEEGLDLRLKQLLGMPHTTERKWFVDFYVWPEDLFRPSRDPEVSDSQAELTFRPDNAEMTTSAKHRDWIAAQLADGQYPWTQLGYTYDWGNPCSKVGLSEFVIREGAEITVLSITETAAYCCGE